MSFIWSLFKSKPNPEDYEAVLSALALDIQQRQQSLSEIRIRERRATLLTTLYTLAVWVAYTGVWYTGILSGRRNTVNGVQRAIRGAPVILGPIFILFIRRIVQIWYARKGDVEEKTLRELLKQQRAKVEEIKKKTNYYTTRDLLQRYDESPSAGSPMRQRASPGAGSSTPNTPSPHRGAQPSSNQAPPSQNLQNSASPKPAGPPRKQWFDKLADAVLGDDSSDLAQYALICEQCFSHNGLVKESVWEETQYVCPKCGHFNPSKKSQRLGQQSSKPKIMTPSSAGASSPLATHSPSPLRGTQPPNPQSPQSPLRKEEKDPGSPMKTE